MSKLVLLLDKPSIGDREAKLQDGNGRYVLHHLFDSKAPMNDLSIEFLSKKSLRRIQAEHQPKVILAFGQEVLKALEIEGKILKLRGSVFVRKLKTGEQYIIPTLDPKNIKKPYNMFMDESIEKGYFVAADIRKAVEIYRNGYKRPKENFNLNPTFKDVKKFVKEAIENKYLLGLDIEATGLNLEYAEIVVLGFSWSEEDAIVIPFKKKGGANYWSSSEWAKIKPLLEKLFQEGSFMAQNGVGYDIPLLRYRGWNFPLKNFKLDTMVYSHILNPEIQHNIGIISSLYGKQPYWKESFLSRKESILETNQEEMKRYNARDCVALHQIKNGMDLHLKALIEKDKAYSRLPEVLERSMKSSRVIIKMHERGILLDHNKLTEWHRFVEKEYKRIKKALRDFKEVPNDFNFESGDHLQYLIFGIKPINWKDKFEQELKFYSSEAKNYQYECSSCSRKITKKFYSFDKVPQKILARCPRCKKEVVASRTSKEPTNVKAKSKDSQKYKKLKIIKDILDMEPLYRLDNYKPLKTPKGDKIASDKKALVRYIASINKRIETIDSLKRKHKAHEKEKENLEKTRKFLNLLLEFSKISKLKSSFWTFKTWQDGRVRTSFLITGTATGRLSAKNPNLMQAPGGEIGKKIRSVFRAPKGAKLLSVD